MSGEVPSAADWAAVVGTSVTLASGEQWLVEECSPERRSGGWAAWTVTFLAPGVVDQGTYQMHAPGLGDVHVFVVPHGRSGDGTRLGASYTVAVPADPADHEPRPAAPAESEG